MQKGLVTPESVEYVAEVGAAADGNDIRGDDDDTVIDELAD